MSDTYEDDGIIRDEIVRTGLNEFYRLKILERRSYFIEAYELCNKRMKRNIKTPTNIVESALESLQMEAGIFLREALAKRPNDAEELDRIIDNAKTLKDFKKAFNLIDKYLYKYSILTNEQDRISGFTIGYNKMYMKQKDKNEPEEVFEE